MLSTSFSDSCLICRHVAYLLFSIHSNYRGRIQELRKGEPNGERGAQAYYGASWLVFVLVYYFLRFFLV